LTARGVILDIVALVSKNVSLNNIKRSMLQAFNNRISTTPEQKPNLINIAAQNTLQTINTIGVEEQDFFNLLSQWLLDELGFSPFVLKQNQKLGSLAEMKSQAQRWFADELQDDSNSLELLCQSAIMEWSIENIRKGDGRRCEDKLETRLFEEDLARGMNMFRTFIGFSGVGPSGRNNSQTCRQL
jgi:hypothetical protein